LSIQKLIFFNLISNYYYSCDKQCNKHYSARKLTIMAPAKPNNREEDKMVRLGSTRKIRFNKKKCAEDILKAEATNMDLKCKVEALETAINQLQTILEEVK
jgi:hypothetical protein